MYLVDTNVLSEFRKLLTGRADVQFKRWFETILAEQLYVSVMSLFEIENGILRLQRYDAEQAVILRTWFEQAKVELEGRIIDVDMAIALRCAALHVPDPRSQRDSFIGATALVRGLTLLTRNVRDFQGMGVQIINPWEPDA
jgi:predicted nucleic acid-binding protein